MTCEAHILQQKTLIVYTPNRLLSNAVTFGVDQHLQALRQTPAKATHIMLPIDAEAWKPKPTS